MPTSPRGSCRTSALTTTSGRVPPDLPAAVRGMTPCRRASQTVGSASSSPWRAHAARASTVAACSSSAGGVVGGGSGSERSSSGLVGAGGGSSRNRCSQALGSPSAARRSTRICSASGWFRPRRRRMASSRSPVHSRAQWTALRSPYARAAAIRNSNRPPRISRSGRHKAFHRNLPGTAARLPQIVGHLHPQPRLRRRAEGFR